MDKHTDMIKEERPWVCISIRDSLTSNLELMSQKCDASVHLWEAVWTAWVISAEAECVIWLCLSIMDVWSPSFSRLCVRRRINAEYHICNWGGSSMMLWLNAYLCVLDLIVSVTVSRDQIWQSKMFGHSLSTFICEQCYDNTDNTCKKNQWHHSIKACSLKVKKKSN